jgi:hypothetical protein
MKRLLVLAALALIYQASPAQAQLLKISGGDAKPKHKSGNEPPPLGPWYHYWPLEAHFQVPALPEYPFFSAPQTVPVVPPAPYGGVSPYAHQGAGPGPGMPYPGMSPYQVQYPTAGAYPGAMPGYPAAAGAAANAPAAAPRYPAAMPYPAAGAYPGMGGYPPTGGYPTMGGYPGMGYPPAGYGGMPQRQ